MEKWKQKQNVNTFTILGFQFNFNSLANGAEIPNICRDKQPLKRGQLLV